MNSRERILAAARGEAVDVLPVAPYMGNHAARVAGDKLINYYTDAKHLAECQLKTWETYGHDVLVSQSDNYYMAEAFGCKIRYHEESIPTVDEVALEKPADIARLRRPDPTKDGRMPMYLEAVQLLKEAVGDEVAIRGCGTGPFVMAGHLFGPQKFLFELGMMEADDGGKGQAFLDLYDLICDTLIEFATLQIEAGATIVQCGDSLAFPGRDLPRHVRGGRAAVREAVF